MLLLLFIWIIAKIWTKNSKTKVQTKEETHIQAMIIFL